MRAIYIGEDTDKICYGQTGTLTSWSLTSPRCMFRADGRIGKVKSEKGLFLLECRVNDPDEYRFLYECKQRGQMPKRNMW